MSNLTDKKFATNSSLLLLTTDRCLVVCVVSHNDTNQLDREMESWRTNVYPYFITEKTTAITIITQKRRTITHRVILHYVPSYYFVWALAGVIATINKKKKKNCIFIHPTYWRRNPFNHRHEKKILRFLILRNRLRSVNEHVLSHTSAHLNIW